MTVDLDTWVSLAAIAVFAIAMFSYLDKKFDRVDKQFDQVDKRLEQVDKRFEQGDKRFESVDKRFESVDTKFDKLRDELKADIAKVDAKIDRLAKDAHRPLARPKLPRSELQQRRLARAVRSE